ncbi:hypothetical protein CMQ_662 [Grosmannia clavigera kw1407]|uniref:Uncharacterized protein n=1 Tax=Grosmannia clavigera (strain kw1407 / UAMH 11150) TaxID=655863 RepID=F0XC19_GROCL|nr:uncharacterized protein CMQ_662 [Grosmannia clavigera kw1407]EFX03734.1 hypothetical protein CMQ_662 [Grosmannia clavigera kw1407]
MGNLFSAQAPPPPPPPPPRPEPASVARPVFHWPPQQTKSKRPCRFHASGRGCWQGSSCRFSHDPAVIAREAREGGGHGPKNGVSSSQKNEMEMPAVNWTRELRGAWVEFVPGAMVPHVSLPSDFSAVRLSNVPVGTSVEKMLGDLNIMVTRDEVRLMPSREPPSKDTYDAIVKVEDPAFAQRMCTILSTCKNKAIRAIGVVQIAVPTPPGLSMNRIDGRRVQCSWLRPERTARLRYSDREAAKRVKKAYEARAYRDVLGPTTGKAHIQAQGKRECIVVLHGLGPKVDTGSVISVALGERDRPIDVVLGEPSYESVPDMDTTMVMSMFTAIGPLESWNKREGAGGRYERAFVTFEDEAHAREAVSSLQSEPLPFGDSRLRLNVEPIFSVSIRVSTRIYGAVKERLNGLIGQKGKKQLQAWDPLFVRLAVMSPHRLFRIVKFEGKDRDAVAQIKDAADRIVAGDVLRCNGIDVWSDAFRNASSPQVARLTLFEPDYGVLLMRDVRSRQLRVFGPEVEYEHIVNAVRALMTDFASSSSSDVHTVRLSDDGFRWVITGGLHELQRYLGRGKAIIDVQPTGSRNLIVMGSAADHATALRLVAGRQASSSRSAAVDGECPICLGEVTEADRPISLACGHIYCADCFTNFCAAGATSGAILCIGDAGRCRNHVSLAELHANLASDTLEDVLAASLDAYVRRHAQELRNCPTPDCTHIYRAGSAASAASIGTSDAANVFTCRSCRASTCRLCHAAHPKRPCAVRLAAEDAEMRKAKAALGLQDCPNCSVAIEKRDGCNHMNCSQCKVHFCWLCLATFEKSDDCYKHMRGLHGGYYS